MNAYGLPDRSAGQGLESGTGIYTSGQGEAKDSVTTQASEGRGGDFTTDQQSFLREIYELILCQNPFFKFIWNNETPIVPGDVLYTLSDFGFAKGTTLQVGGELPLRNGYFTGYGVLTVQQFAAATGLQFRVYRNGVATNLKFVLTDHHNWTNIDSTAAGARRVRGFNIFQQIIKEDTVVVTNAFKSNDRIAVVTEPIELPGYTDAADITYLFVNLWYNSSRFTPEEALAQGYGGGTSVTGGGTEGGGGGGGEEPGGGGEITG